MSTSVWEHGRLLTSTTRAAQLYALNKAKNRRMVRVAGINDLDGLAIVSAFSFYDALGTDLGQVQQPPTPDDATCASVPISMRSWCPLYQCVPYIAADTL